MACRTPTLDAVFFRIQKAARFFPNQEYAGTRLYVIVEAYVAVGGR
jgi:hypothetical protein